MRYNKVQGWASARVGKQSLLLRSFIDINGKMYIIALLLALVGILVGVRAEEDACTAESCAASKCLLDTQLDDSAEWDTTYNSKLYTNRCTV